MSNSITGITTFSTGTVIKSVPMNTNFTNIITTSEVWNKYTVAYTDINTTSAAFTATVFQLDPNEYINGYTVKHNTAFVGTAITTITVALGIAGDNTKHTDDFDVGQGVTDTAFDFTGLNLIESFANTTAVYARFTAAGANLDSLTAGSVDIWVLKSKLP